MWWKLVGILTHGRRATQLIPPLPDEFLKPLEPRVHLVCSDFQQRNEHLAGFCRGSDSDNFVRIAPPIGTYGTANAKSVLAVEGACSAPRRLTPELTSDVPVLTATYCRPLAE